MESIPAHGNRSQAPLRVFMWVAVFAFFAGFAGYLAVHLSPQTGASQMAIGVEPPQDVYKTPTRLSPPDAPWAFEKSI
ncbi:hypothetical protein [Phenylobacterium sp.]|uniref:hypothetical protein n=1 Tax=Phenylobacterium sp. TaxID=1871053 RepID=UPI00273004C5|nr:hypothetical protein [Phenylobacterium sp.]MDP1617071.1 hypothetical protein [Phenylobacterium sp.]MDP1989248.1 hypothetical protein [Phenylobacterium sp.]